jgi:hypothetical protein
MAEQTGRCHAIARSGQPCRMRAAAGRPYCVNHDPERAAEHAAQSRRGGYGKSNKARLRKSVQVAALTADETVRVLAGYFLRLAADDDGADRATGATLAMMARAILDGVRTTDLEAQVADLQRTIAELAEALAERTRTAA